MSKIVVVVPSIRDAQMQRFRTAWKTLFERHKVTLVTVWDGETPQMEETDYGDGTTKYWPAVLDQPWVKGHRDLFCRYTDAVRNIGLVHAAILKPTYVLTLDDDVEPYDASGVWPQPAAISTGLINDPIADHIAVLHKRVPISWMNTAHCDREYLRGVPYGIRSEAPVMLSHGVWDGTPDFDGETQLRLEKETGSVPYSLPYFIGPIPKGVLFPLCGMNVMVKAAALPYLYFAPMGRDTGVVQATNEEDGTIREYSLNRFADIWMGVFLKRKFDERGWACYTGGSAVFHTRASDARKNATQEKLGRQWNETMWKTTNTENDILSGMWAYYQTYSECRSEYAKLVAGILEAK